MSLLAIASEGELVPLRPLRVELFQSGLIKVGGKPVSLKRFASRLRSSRNGADILCIWHEPKVLNGRPAFDIEKPGEIDRLTESMRATGIIAEASQRMPTFYGNDGPCAQQ